MFSMWIVLYQKLSLQLRGRIRFQSHYIFSSKLYNSTLIKKIRFPRSLSQAISNNCKVFTFTLPSSERQAGESSEPFNKRFTFPFPTINLIVGDQFCTGFFFYFAFIHRFRYEWHLWRSQLRIYSRPPNNIATQ